MAQAVVGLGNAGAKYRGTRHNIGHQVLHRLADLLEARRMLLTGFRPMPNLGKVARGTCETDPILLFKPAGFMNESGRWIERFLDRYALAPADLILVYDDIDLPVGKVRVRLKGSHGGHKGVESVIESLGTEAVEQSLKLLTSAPAPKA